LTLFVSLSLCNCCNNLCIIIRVSRVRVPPSLPFPSIFKQPRAFVLALRLRARGIVTPRLQGRARRLGLPVPTASCAEKRDTREYFTHRSRRLIRRPARDVSGLAPRNPRWSDFLTTALMLSVATAPWSRRKASGNRHP